MRCEMGKFIVFVLVAGAIIWACLHYDVAATVKAHFYKAPKEKDPDAPSKIDLGKK